MNGDDLAWMDLALGEAEKGRGLVEPNPMVGAVIVRDGQVVGLGHHARFGGPHAEVAALQQAGEAARGATLYVTLEPCCHHGKTPPCTEAIVRSGVARVVAAMRDPFPKVDGGGLAALRAAGVAVELGLRAANGGRTQRPLPEAALDRAALRHGQVGHDPRRQDRRRVGRQPVDLLAKRRDRWSTSSGDGWTRSSSASAPSWPTTPSSPPVRPAPARPSGSCSTARPHFPRPAGSPQTARDVPVLVAVTEAAPPPSGETARGARLRGPRPPGTAPGRHRPVAPANWGVAA